MDSRLRSEECYVQIKALCRWNIIGILMCLTGTIMFIGGMVNWMPLDGSDGYVALMIIGFIVMVCSFIPICYAHCRKQQLPLTIDINNYYDKLVAAGCSEKEIVIEIERYIQSKQSIAAMRSIAGAVIIGSINNQNNHK